MCRQQHLILRKFLVNATHNGHHYCSSQWTEGTQGRVNVFPTCHTAPFWILPHVFACVLARVWWLLNLLLFTDGFEREGEIFHHLLHSSNAYESQG